MKEDKKFSTVIPVVNLMVVKSIIIGNELVRPGQVVQVSGEESANMVSRGVARAATADECKAAKGIRASGTVDPGVVKQITKAANGALKGCKA